MLSLNIPLWKLFGWFRRLQLWATGDWQLYHDNVPAHASCLLQSFLVKQQITQDTQLPYSPDLVHGDFYLFRNSPSGFTKTTFERVEISDHRWDSEKCDEAADGDWENCVRSQRAYFEGDWGFIVLCTVFLVSCIFFNKCLYFSYCMAGCLLERPHIIFSTLWFLVSVQKPKLYEIAYNMCPQYDFCLNI